MVSSAISGLMCSLVTEMSSSNGVLDNYEGINITNGATTKLYANNNPSVYGIKYALRSNTGSVATFQPAADDCIVLCCPNKHHGCDWTGTLTNAVDHIKYNCSYKIPSLNKDNTMPVILTMTGFEHKRTNNESWYSPVFCSHESRYHFRLRVDANGWCGTGGAVAVVVSIVKGDYDDQLRWPFEGIITVQILNHISNSAHSIVKEFIFSSGGYECQKVTDETQPEFGCWCNRFIMHKSLHYNPIRQSQYLNNDCLLFLVNHSWKL